MREVRFAVVVALIYAAAGVIGGVALDWLRRGEPVPEPARARILEGLATGVLLLVLGAGACILLERALSRWGLSRRSALLVWGTIALGAGWLCMKSAEFLLLGGGVVSYVGGVVAWTHFVWLVTERWGQPWLRWAAFVPGLLGAAWAVGRMMRWGIMASTMGVGP